MSLPDRSEEVLVALKAYFSGPIAKALLSSTLRRAGLEGRAVDDGSLPEVVQALERTLPMYLGDPGRRKECMDGLRKLAGLAAAPPAKDVTADRPVAGARPGPGVKASNGAAPVAASAATVIRVRSADDVMNACEVGKDLCRKLGFASVDQTKIATAIAEFARNILQYAREGEIRISTVISPKRGIEIVASDSGPGIRDLELVMSTAYKSKTGMGMGLKGSKRLMDNFEITSAPEVGTTVVARKFVS